MQIESIISLSIMCVLIIIIYSIGIWAGRNIEREVEKIKIIKARIAQEEKKNKRLRR